MRARGGADERDGERSTFEALMFGSGGTRRWTQDTPVLPDVWLAYWEMAESGRLRRHRGARRLPPIELLVTPHGDSDVGALRSDLMERLKVRRDGLPARGGGLPRVVYNQTTLSASLDFVDLVRCVLPMTDWWRKLLATFDFTALRDRVEALAVAVEDPERPRWPLGATGERSRLAPGLLWMLRVGGALALRDRGEPLPWKKVPSPRGSSREPAPAPDAGWFKLVQAIVDLLWDLPTAPSRALAYSISRNRDASTALWRSALAVKADAARQLFNIRCEKLTWAVLDAGVDARHPAFRERAADGVLVAKAAFHDDEGKPRNCTRVTRTYDFCQIEELLDPGARRLPEALARQLAGAGVGELERKLHDLHAAIRRGRAVDWGLIEPLLRVPHRDGEYEPPANDHGTHVAGILGGDLRRGDTAADVDDDLVGICRDIQLIDLRVLDAQGRGKEFAIIAALQFLRYLNSAHDYTVVHGVNISLSIPHDVANYACGRTPVCDEAERAVAAGIVVVAAAGNHGYRRYATVDGVTADAYNSISITDPGNAEAVITVGATHRYRPHTYGVSYFSSRGPTGDGRAKPDLVAPGEKIEAPVPDELVGVKDGTSMAAPHVSGAAALLMARHGELVGQPGRIKEILCRTATDLGRERYFQGAGMLDVLRALQAV